MACPTRKTWTSQACTRSPCLHKASQFQRERDSGIDATYQGDGEVSQRGSFLPRVFRNTDLRRTEIAYMVWITQALRGSAMRRYTACFCGQARFSTVMAFDLSIDVYIQTIMGGMLAWVAMSRAGRRTLYLAGYTLYLDHAPSHWDNWILERIFRPGMGFGLLDHPFHLLLRLVLVRSINVSLPRYPPRVYAKTVVLARIAYNICSVINNILVPYMLNPTIWNLGGQFCFP